MTYGWVCCRLPLSSLIAMALLLVAPSLFARPAPTSDLMVTLLSQSAGAIQVQGGDGRSFSVKITRSTWVLRHGLVVAPREFLPGETLRVRLGHGQEKAAVLVCDAETADALDAHRGRPLTGTLVRADGRTWIIQFPDSAVPLTLCLFPRTTFRAGGASMTESAFSAGATVTVATRGLANGLLAAVSVSEASTEKIAEPTPHPSKIISGIVVESRPDLGLLTIQDKAGTAQTVAVTGKTRVKVRKQPAALGEVVAGMRVTAWLGAALDAAGHSVATTVSASAK